jgi:heme-degrading monooxygenase HmoA
MEIANHRHLLTKGDIMYARLTIASINPTNKDKAIALYRDTVITAMRKQKGYRQAFLLGADDSDKGITVSLWDSEEDAIANEKSGYFQSQIDAFKGVFAAPPKIEGYEVIVSDMQPHLTQWQSGERSYCSRPYGTTLGFP